MEQRDLLAAMRDEPLEAQLSTFDWFGSYMVEEVVDEISQERSSASGFRSASWRTEIASIMGRWTGTASSLGSSTLTAEARCRLRSAAPPAPLGASMAGHPADAGGSAEPIKEEGFDQIRVLRVRETLQEKGGGPRDRTVKYPERVCRSFFTHAGFTITHPITF